MAIMHGAWPPMPLSDWRDTYGTLHMYSQIVGKIRLAQSPMTNQWWQVTLYLTSRGLTTGPVPGTAGTFDLRFDFFDHLLYMETSAGERRTVPLGLPVQDFYREVMGMLEALGHPVHIWTQPVEVATPIPFDQDTRRTYDPAAAQRCWEVLLEVDRIFKVFRSEFRGKCSPVHFFWGAFDLAVTRFSGRMAPPKPGADRVQRLGYDEEVSSLGFWPGGPWPGAGEREALFYSYMVPKPDGLEAVELGVEGAGWDPDLGEFVLSYEAVRSATDPEQRLLAFARAAYAAGARVAGWPVEALTYRPDGRPVVLWEPGANARSESQV